MKLRAKNAKPLAPDASAALRPNRPVPFDNPVCQHLAGALRKTVGTKLQPGERLEVAGELAQSHSLVRCELHNADDSAAVELEVCVETEPNQLEGPLQARDLALDALQTLLRSFFESERLLFLPPLWQSHDFEGRSVLFRGARRSPKLEAEAEIGRAHV